MNMNSKALCLLTLMASCVVAAKEPTEVFLDERHPSDLIDFDLPYRLLVPETIEDGKTYPLVLQMHGAGFRGSDNRRQLSQVISRSWLNPVLREAFPAFVVIPHCPGGETRWFNYPRKPHDVTEFDTEALTENPLMDVVMELVDSLQQKLPIDSQRIYLIGNSMGGFATWYLAAAHPDRFAAAVPICGSGDPRMAARLTEIPLWVFHGDKDSTIPVEGSRKMVTAILNHGGQPHYTEFAGIGHNVSGLALRDESQSGIPDVYEWLFSQRKE
jgi:predicted peptidase